MRTRTVKLTPGERPNLCRLVVLAGLGAITALLVNTPARAQDRMGEIDQMFSWTTPNGAGCAPGVARTSGNPVGGRPSGR